ncbi:hypothetical protein Tco_1358100, partial [Tanacetum coccineum]
EKTSKSDGQMQTDNNREIRTEIQQRGLNRGRQRAATDSDRAQADADRQEQN